MTEYDNTNRGSIWKNDKKVKDTDPDFTGSVNVAGVEFWVNAWKRKEGANPKAPALSFSIKPKEQASFGSYSNLAKNPNAYADATGRRDPISSGPLDRDDAGDIPF